MEFAADIWVAVLKPFLHELRLSTLFESRIGFCFWACTIPNALELIRKRNRRLVGFESQVRIGFEASRSFVTRVIKNGRRQPI
jgi:hypothetical protein